jgi:hypothetical protein
MQVERLGASV